MLRTRRHILLKIPCVAAVLLASIGSAFAGTGFLKSEETSGLNRICYYDGATGGFAKTISSSSLCPLTADDGRSLSAETSQENKSNSTSGFLSGEKTNGLNKTCFYDSARGSFTKNVRPAQICPISANQ